MGVNESAQMMIDAYPQGADQGRQNMYAEHRRSRRYLRSRSTPRHSLVAKTSSQDVSLRMDLIADGDPSAPLLRQAVAKQ